MGSSSSRFRRRRRGLRAGGRPRPPGPPRKPGGAPPPPPPGRPPANPPGPPRPPKPPLGPARDGRPPPGRPAPCGRPGAPPPCGAPAPGRPGGVVLRPGGGGIGLPDADRGGPGGGGIARSELDAGGASGADDAGREGPPGRPASPGVPCFSGGRAGADGGAAVSAARAAAGGGVAWVEGLGAGLGDGVVAGAVGEVDCATSLAGRLVTRPERLVREVEVSGARAAAAGGCLAAAGVSPSPVDLAALLALADATLGRSWVSAAAREEVATLAGAGSSVATGRLRPSASAFRRTRSACASSMDDEWLFTPMPSASARSSASLLLRPSSRASS